MWPRLPNGIVRDPGGSEALPSSVSNPTRRTNAAGSAMFDLHGRLLSPAATFQFDRRQLIRGIREAHDRDFSSSKYMRFRRRARFRAQNLGGGIVGTLIAPDGWSDAAVRCR
jgi:hypothetical protein